MPAAEVNSILEDCKSNGVLIGKGGFYANVSSESDLFMITAVIFSHCTCIMQRETAINSCHCIVLTHCTCNTQFKLFSVLKPL